MTQAATTSGIPSARKKLERAKVHLQALNDEVHGFRKQSPYEFGTTSPGNEPGKPDIYITITVREAAPIPDSWAPITGDILTNLRAALDHAVYPHIRQRKPDLSRKYIQYPIDDRPEQWEPHKPWFAKTVRVIVGESQPYRDADPPLHPLRVLRELVNMDKHRDLVLANYAVDDFHIDEQHACKVVGRTVFITEMVPGAVVAKAHLQLIKRVEGESLKQFSSYVSYGEDIKIPGPEKRLNLLGGMAGLVKTVENLLNDLDAASC